MIKPIIPQRVADAIESFREHGFPSNENIIKVAHDRGAAVTPRLVAIRSIPFDTLLAALVNGYEREVTPEQLTHEKILRQYVQHRDRTTYDTGYRYGVEMALNALGIAIDGVNA